MEEGCYVLVPLGPRTLIGVVWALKSQAPEGTKLRDVITRFDMPAMGETHRKFVDWLADYYVEPKGNVLRMVLRVPAAFEEAKGQIAYRASGQKIRRMTPQRQRVLEVAAEGFAMRLSELAKAAGVGTSVVKSLDQGRCPGGRSASRPQGFPGTGLECRWPHAFQTTATRSPRASRRGYLTKRQGHAL